MSAYAIQSSVLDIRNRSASLRGYPSLAEMKEKELVLAGDEHIMNEFQQEIDFRAVGFAGGKREEKGRKREVKGRRRDRIPCVSRCRNLNASPQPLPQNQNLQSQLRRMLEHAKARRLHMERRADLMRHQLGDATEVQSQAERTLMVSKEEVRRAKEKIRALQRRVQRKEADRKDELFQRREELGDILAVRSMRRKNAQRRQDIRAGVDGDLDAAAEVALIEEANQITLKQTTLATFSKSVKTEINKCECVCVCGRRVGRGGGVGGVWIEQSERQ